jgi:hypothetical protein
MEFGVGVSVCILISLNQKIKIIFYKIKATGMSTKFSCHWVQIW